MALDEMIRNRLLESVNSRSEFGGKSGHIVDMCKKWNWLESTDFWGHLECDVKAW